MNQTTVTLLIVGLVVGVVAGYGVGVITHQSQISQLQSDLSETQSTLSTTQSEVESLQDQLNEAKDTLTTTEENLTNAQTTITSLEAQLSESEAEYTTLSSEYDEFKSDVTSLINSLNKKLDVEAQVIKVWVHSSRGEEMESRLAIMELGTYVDEVRDDELSAIWDDMFTYLIEGKETEATSKFADLVERNTALIQSDLSELDTLLGS